MLRILFIFLSLAYALNSWAAQAPFEHLVLGLGQTTVIKRLSESIHLSQGESLRLHPLKTGILVSAKKEGESWLRVGTYKYNVTVLTEEKFKTYTQIQNILKHKLGLKLKIEKQNLIITGNLYRFSDWEELSHLTGPYEFRAELDPDVKSMTTKVLLKKLSLFRDTNYSLLISPKVRLEIYDPSKKESFETAIKNYGVPVFVSKTKIDLKPLVKVKIFVAEINRQFHQKIGVSWNSALAVKLLPQFSDQSDIVASLNHIETEFCR